MRLLSSFSALACRLAAALVVLAGLTIAVAHAQNAAMPVGQQQCGQFVESFRQGADGYTPYMGYVQGAMDARSAPDSLRRSSPAALALWLNNWCSSNPLRPFSDATVAMIEQAGGGSTAQRPAAPPTVVVVPTQAPSCKVSPTKYCSGCAATCELGEKAYCNAGVDSMGANGCINFAHCGCLKR